MDTERTPEGCEQRQDNPSPTGTDKTNTHWDEWEFACLLNRVLEGWEFEPIGVGLRRTAAACKRMLARLLDGETPCPERYKPILEEVRGKFPPEPKRHTDRKADCEQIRQQYLALTKNLEAMANRLAGIESPVVYLLVTKVVEGCIPDSEISRFCPPAISRSVLKIAGAVREHRKQHADLFTKEQSTVSDQPSAENPKSEIPNPQSEGAAE